MKPEKEKRVTYFSKEDLSYRYNLAIAEPILLNYDNSNNYNINDIIELYQIKQYIDNNFILPNWSETDITQFKKTAQDIGNTVRLFWISIDDNNFLGLFDSIEMGYQPAFWSLTEYFKIYKNISNETFKEILNNSDLWIQEVLHQSNLVNYFGLIIKDYLLGYNEAAEYLLIQYEEKHDSNYPILYFPNCLSVKDKEHIILKYLDYQDANLNYIRLIVSSRDNSIKLSPHTRLKAKRIEKKLNNEILEKGYTWVSGNKVTLSKDQDEPYKVTWENNIQEISYSKKWLDQQIDNLSLLHNFSLLFNYTDIFGCITLVSKSNEVDILEQVMTHSKNNYLIGQIFIRKSNLSHLQIVLYSHYLKQINRSIEGIISFFIKEYIREGFGINDYRINFPSKNTSFLEKVRLIAPEIESVLKQYKLYVEDGFIEHDLLQISSKPFIFKEIPSLAHNKYVYGIGEEFQKMKYYFFSNQSMLLYTKPYKNKYSNLYGLLISEKVILSNFSSYQETIINKLIQDGYLFVDSDGFVRIKDKITLSLIGKLSIDDVLCYWHFPESIRVVIDKMEADGLVYFGNTLFSEPEFRYFNYYLNKSEFTNGLDLRNRYAHGTNTDSENEHKNVYLILLKLLVLIVLKIEDDLLINKNLK